MDKVWVLLPAHNEADRIAGIIRGVRALPLRDVELHILVLDDGSTDGTADVAKGAGAAVVSFQKNRGAGAAIRRGFQIARAEDAAYVVHIDADGQLDPAQIPSLLSVVREGRADVAAGSRFLDGAPAYLAGWKSRVLKMAAAFTGFVLGTRLTDLSCGLRCLNRKALNAARPTFDYDHTQETLIQVLAAGLRVVEMPVHAVRGNAGRRGMSGRVVRYSVHYSLIVAYAISSFLVGRARHLARRITAEESWRRMRWGLLAVAIVYSCLQWPLVLSDLDTTRVLGYGLSVLDGKGLVSEHPIVEDLSQTYKSPLIDWPPMVSFLLVRLTPLAGDPERALIMVGWMASAIFFLSWFSIIEGLKGALSVRARLLIWLLWAMGPDPLFSANISWGLGIAFFSLGIALAAWSLRRDRAHLAMGAASGAAMGLAFVTHFASWPYGIVVPAAAAISAWKGKAPRQWKIAWGHLGVALIILAAFVFWRHVEAGHVTFISQRQIYGPGELRWDFLGTVYPFFNMAVGFERYWLFFKANVVAYTDHFPREIFTPRLWVPAGALACAYVLYLFRTLGRRRDPTGPAAAERFVAVAGILLTLCTVGTLAYLSVRVNGGPHSFLEVPRYYAAILPFVAIGLAAHIFPATPAKRGPAEMVLLSFVATLLVLSLFIVYVRGLYIVLGTEARRSNAEMRAAIRSGLEERPAGLPAAYIHNLYSDSVLREMVMLRYPVHYVWFPIPELKTSEPVFVVMSLPLKGRAGDPFYSLFKDAEMKELVRLGRRKLVSFVLKPGTYRLRWD